MSRHETLIAELRAAATLLDQFNDLWDGTKHEWTPESLRQEADFLEANP